MNPFPLNRLVRVHRVHAPALVHQKCPHGSVISRSRLRSRSPSLTDGAATPKNREVPIGDPWPPTKMGQDAAEWLEPDDGKLSRPVLRGEGSLAAPDLPDSTQTPSTSTNRGR